MSTDVLRVAGTFLRESCDIIQLTSDPQLCCSDRKVWKHVSSRTCRNAGVSWYDAGAGAVNKVGRGGSSDQVKGRRDPTFTASSLQDQ
jgi:hypothetical protein